MTTLLIARHGETEWNATHRWQGFAGPPLNERGRGQARDLARRLSTTRIDAVYSSDTVRAVETAEIVASRLNLEVREDPRLREVDFGEWEGLTREEIDARYSRAFRDWDACKLAAPPGGETDLEMADRVLEALGEIAERHEEACVLVVTSGGPLRAVQADAEGVDQAVARLHFARVDNCATIECVADTRGLTLA